MRDQALALKKESKPAKSNFEMDLDEVIQSLEEAAQEIEKVDWEHGALAANDRRGGGREIFSMLAETKKVSLQG